MDARTLVRQGGLALVGELRPDHARPHDRADRARRADAGPDEPVPNTDELEAVRWFTREEIGAALRGEGEIQLSPRISISRWLIERWHARPRN